MDADTICMVIALTMSLLTLVAKAGTIALVKAMQVDCSTINQLKSKSLNELRVAKAQREVEEQKRMAVERKKMKLERKIMKLKKVLKGFENEKEQNRGRQVAKRLQTLGVSS